MRIHTAAILIGLSIIFSTAYAQNADTTQPTTFTKVEKEAGYPGGEEKWKRFLERNLNANVPVKNGAPVGIYSVYVQFIVNKDGSVSDMKALTALGYGMENEVIRILSKAPAWEPATIDGRPVRAYRKQPVTFQVVDEAFDLNTYTIYADKDNAIAIRAGKLEPEDLDVTVSRGTIALGSNGKFIIHVTGHERVLLEIRNKKNNKKIGAASLEVRSQSPART